MTNNEIIKALEYCKNDDCDNCPNTFGNCYSNLAGAALDLLKRQQAEIAQKDEQIEKLVSFQRFCEKKAIKEFAERLKANLSFGKYITAKQIDNLAKEMTGSCENAVVMGFDCREIEVIGGADNG